jgi:hypothetical protein
MLGPPPTAPRRPSRLSSILAAVGDTLTSAGQVYRGVHPRSAATGPIPSSNYYQTLQDRYATDLDKYDQDLSRRGLITAQMAPNLVGQYEDRAEAAERNKTEAASTLLQKRIAEGKITSDPDNLTKVLDAYAPTYLDPSSEVTGALTLIDDLSIADRNAALRDVLQRRFPDMSPKDIELAVLGMPARALEHAAGVASKTGSAVANLESARKNRIVSDWQDRYGGQPLEIQRDTLKNKMAEVMSKYKAITTAVTNIGKIGDPNFNITIWKALLEDAGIPEELAGVRPPNPAPEEEEEGMLEGEEGMEEGMEGAEGMEGMSGGEIPAGPGGVSAPPRGGGGTPGPQGAGQPAPTVQLPPERQAELDKLAEDLAGAAQTRDYAALRRLLIRYGYTMAEVSQMTSSELLTEVTGVVLQITDLLAPEEAGEPTLVGAP